MSDQFCTLWYIIKTDSRNQIKKNVCIIIDTIHWYSRWSWDYRIIVYSNIVSGLTVCTTLDLHTASNVMFPSSRLATKHGYRPSWPWYLTHIYNSLDVICVKVNVTNSYAVTLYFFAKVMTSESMGKSCGCINYVFLFIISVDLFKRVNL